MRRYLYVLLALGLAVGAWAGAAANLGAVVATSLQTALLYVNPTVDVAPGEKHFGPIAAQTGSATADTVRGWRRSIKGLADDNAATLVGSLDTTSVYSLEMLIVGTGGSPYTIRYVAVFNLPGGSFTVSSDSSSGASSVFHRVGTAVTGTTGTDAFFTTGFYRSGATGLIDVENRLGSLVDVYWHLEEGGG